jgi:hypothetical protein
VTESIHIKKISGRPPGRCISCIKPGEYPMSKSHSRRAVLAGKAATKSKRSPAASSDTRLIKECVIYGQEIAAFYAGFEADPDGSSKHASGLGGRHEDRARRALTQIATTNASTPAGLDAKARILPLVIEDSDGSGGVMEEADEAFYRSFTADVRAFLDPLIRGSGLSGISSPSAFAFSTV